MTRRILFRTVWLLVILGIGVTRAHAELPAVVEVAVPGGGKIRVALPPHICAYPKEVRDRLAQFLLGSEDGLHLLGAGGACADIDHLIREGTAVVSPSMQLAMQKNQIDPITRSTPASYRRLCFEQFPSKGEPGVADPLRRSLTEADQKLTLGETASLGLLAATRDAVFGGLLAEISRAPHRLLQIQVIACFSPGDVPLLWTFQEAVDYQAGLDNLAERIQAMLVLAKAQVKATIDLGRKQSAP